MKCRASVRVGLSVGLLLFGAPTLADDILITWNHCSSEVHGVAHDAHLFAVLKRLAEVLDFQLYGKSDNDPLVTIDTTRSPSDLLGSLTRSENVSMTQVRDARCPHQQRVLQVWLLPTNQNGSPRVSASAPQVVPF